MWLAATVTAKQATASGLHLAHQSLPANDLRPDAIGLSSSPAYARCGASIELPAVLFSSCIGRQPWQAVFAKGGKHVDKHRLRIIADISDDALRP
jgi:hypothetical protein